MPSGTRKRPDTLELEVLGARQVESSEDEECGITTRVLPKSHQKHYQLQPEQRKQAPKPQSSKAAKSQCISDGNEKSSPPLQEQHHIQPISTHKTRHGWFHLRRKPLAAPAENVVLSQLPVREISAKGIGTVNTATATLGKPETSAHANATTTSTTTLPTSLTIPNVAAVLPRSDSKKRRSRTQTDSLYSLATLAQTGEIQAQPHSEPQVPRAIGKSESDHLPWSCCTEQSNVAHKEAESKIYLNDKTITPQTTHAFRERSAPEHMLLTPELASAEDVADGALPPPVHGFQARLKSVFGNLSSWKSNECVRRRSRSTRSTINATTTGEGALGGNGGAEGISGLKGLSVSADFEQFSTTAVNGAGSGNSVFASAKDMGVRRLSQMRRRRSSYYFSENERRIRANDREFNAQFKYADNFIKTSKYTLLTFLPFNLLEQFQRLANFYFLCLLVLQLIPAISSLTPVTTAIPLIGVLTLTAVKDAYDDIQRHLSDSQVNNRRSKTLRNGQLIDAKWSGVQVGDVIRLENNQFVAADILLLTTSEPNGLCFIETAELDGETNLKCKQCLPEITELGQRHDLLWNFNGEIICERPNNLLNKFEGTLIWRNQRYALDNEKILLRGCVLRNTQWCYGVVVFAGKDTKLMQNSGKTQFKSTGVDRLLNFIIIGIVLFLLSICAFFTLACAIWESFIGQHFQVYLPWENIIPKNVAQGSTVIGLLVFFSYAIVLNTVVPISLYVSVEVIRFAQSFLINWDEEMYYERSKTHAKARTTTLNEELGQIQYIFSDKTGTLTQNIMTFNKCSINGRTYGDVFDLRTGEVIEVTDKQKYVQNSNFNLSGSNSANKSTPAPTILLHTAEVHPKSTVMVSSPEEGGATDVSIASTNSITTKDVTLPMTADMTMQTAMGSPTPESSPSPSVSKRQLQYEESPIDSSKATEATAQHITWRQRSVSQSPSRRMRRQVSTLSNASDKALEPVDFSANPEFEPEFRWYDKTLLDAVRSDEEHTQNFFRLLALCHTVMPEYVEGRLEYQAQSPDEAALVSAARNFGFVFRSRTPNSITIEVMGNREDYVLLNILDFNNVRKRMSVILRRGDNIILYCKGADNVIYDRLSTSQNDIKARTQDHLNKFAGEGLRTLVLAERRLDEDYYMEWLERQQIAAVSLDAREEKLSAMYEEIESELILVGVTAIEDKLQDGVPQTIANLQMAGLKIWVLTGDKQETAINIGYSCQLLTDELADVFIVDGSSLEEVDKQLRQFRESVRILNRFRPTQLEPNVNLNLNLNGANSADRNSTSVMYGTGFRTQTSPPPAPAISVVTFRWDDDKIKHNKGEPDSAECNELYDNIEKGGDGATTLHPDEIIEENTGFAIVINGHSLVYCLSPELESRFLDVASQCKAVICCRVTPLQKALVVELIKRAKNAVTLAIGDGANDVSMIKAAHIGVGISGQEGLQAVLASDYSIAQFRYLERLLLVHGRWSYYRMCKFLRYFFYKNFAFTLCHCWYSFFCGFSAQTVFDPMFISVYNLFYTSLPVLALGVFEQDVSDKHSVEYPKLYTPGLKSQLFNTREFVYSVLHGAFSSLILFLIPYGTYKDGVSPNGLILSDHMTLGAVVATILIIDNTAQIALYTSYWTIFNHITIWGSLVCFFVLDYFYNYVFGGPYVGSLAMAMKDLTFWTTMVITVIMIMAPVLAYKFYLIDVHPSLADKIRLKCRVSTRSRQSNMVMRTPSARKARRSLRSGYAFAHQEGFGRLITSGKIMRKLPQEFAFPLGLGSKKLQPQTTDGSDGKNNQNNNNSTRSNKNSSTGYLNDNDPESATGGRGSNGARSDENVSPRAPCQDLDTINL
ncbi:phospholipid-transporting ATPase ID isoform X1 [Anastrepha ludens]|uniref:phospholipid-transporting ATPase ID isoform X1 n=1 Tax=Anastrepha ludens TaxID=28586 RepID=UPI0023AF5A26|nr:phospholipid-transporting ATPase ID isoform X1 [Anastrepha ludens]XP_053948291.1 phospholipid-transporting ATPase ID isoform X1 [Anastrepha ludens]XP_053948292.1 phospholipid-transporting ATPase ID isoform X1 [Anastrepha ludens]